MFEAQLLSTPLIVIAALRARAAFQPASSSAEVFAGALALSWVAMLALFVWMRSREAELRAAVAGTPAAPAAERGL
jgi:hypothetical protein